MKLIYIALLACFCITVFPQQLFAHPPNEESLTIGLSSCNAAPTDTLWGLLQQQDFDAFLFLGDNIYLPSTQRISEQTYETYYSKIFSSQSFHSFLRSTHELPIWDDHDYGPNNSDETFYNRKLAENIFRDHWKIEPRPTGFSKGIHRTTQIGFIKFILTDNRSFRKNTGPSKQRTHFGTKQLQWIIREIQNTKDSLIILASGGQLLTRGPLHEQLQSFPTEFQALIQAVETAQVPVIIASGDRHFGDILDRRLSDQAEVLEITASPLSGRTALPHIPYPQIGRRRVLVGRPHFGQLTVTKGKSGFNVHATLVDAKSGEPLRQYRKTLRK